MALPPRRPAKGHGALSNPPGRFNREQVERVDDDGWYLEEEGPSAIPVSVEPDRARSVITRNDSPDVPFDYSINPYRGCAHACTYCLSPDTPILMSDGRTRAIADLKVGDEIYGTVRRGRYRRYVKTQVLAHWSVLKPAYRIALEDGTELIAGGDHRFLTDRGWKFVSGTMGTSDLQRPYLTTDDKLMGTGASVAVPEQAAEYRQGGLREHLRFFHIADPAITRRRDISGQAVKSSARLRVAAVERLRGAMRLYDMSTGTGDFLANGVISHNCYARPSHAYLGLSPGLDFETKLFYKADVARVLIDELARPGYVCRPIALGTNTDPYQPLERRLRVTRSILEVLQNCKHPVTIVTKSSLILRDLDILADLARQGLVHVSLSVTTLDAELKRKLEPLAAAPHARLATIRALAAEDIPVGALVAPVIPGLTDHELERIVEAVADAGASSAGYVLLRLPYEVKTLFREWLAEHYPQRAEHVMALIRDLRGGADNDPRFGHRMRGIGPYAELLSSRFRLACRRAGLEDKRDLPLITTLFKPPGPQAELPLDL